MAAQFWYNLRWIPNQKFNQNSSNLWFSETLEATTESISKRITLIGPKVEELSKKIEVRLFSSGMQNFSLKEWIFDLAFQFYD